jgi:hypothetical protein
VTPPADDHLLEVWEAEEKLQCGQHLLGVSPLNTLFNSANGVIQEACTTDWSLSNIIPLQILEIYISAHQAAS